MTCGCLADSDLFHSVDIGGLLLIVYLWFSYCRTMIGWRINKVISQLFTRKVTSGISCQIPWSSHNFHIIHHKFIIFCPIRVWDFRCKYLQSLIILIPSFFTHYLLSPKINSILKSLGFRLLTISFLTVTESSDSPSLEDVILSKRLEEMRNLAKEMCGVFLRDRELIQEEREVERKFLSEKITKLNDQ